MIQVKAPARICFFGDHQDYLDLPVIAGTINRYIYIEGTPNSTTNLFLQFIDIDKDMSIDLNEQLNTIHNEDYIRSVLVVLRKQGFILRKDMTSKFGAIFLSMLEYPVPQP